MNTWLVIGTLLFLSGATQADSATFCNDGFCNRPNSTTTQRPGNTTTPAPSRNRCNGMPDETLFPSITDCAYFVTCQGGLEMELECRPEGTLFDYERLVCDHPENVQCYEHDRCSTEEDGRILPSKICSNFFICRNGVKSEEITCVPDGTLFDYQRGVCDHPSNVVCWGSSSPNLCAGKPDGALVPSVECSNFFECKDGQHGEEITCLPAGTVFDYQREVCDFPENVVCWTPGGESTTGAPTRPPRPEDIPHDICRGVVIDAIPHPSDCTQFIVCVLGQPTVEQCPPNYIFYPLFRVCGYGNTETCEIDSRWVEEYLKGQGRIEDFELY
ncbi:chitin-binding domain protein cbd-1-like [Ochlerotatus camptorhynchus]|uniref:chitin-binding domain protein cbd-1-like n=1 Tax=Ochlerotatus camptorhynchus TaxID=644619 RepID=UPI0031DD7295